MLPIRKSNDVVELDSSDLIEDASRPALERRTLPPPREPPTTRFRAPVLLRASVEIDEDVEDDVAGECLATIAAESSKIPPMSVTASTVPSPPSSRLERASIPPPSSEAALASAPRLPAPSPPPFVRTSSGSFAAAPSSGGALEPQRDSKPSIFTRTSASPPDATPVTSVAPVAMSTATPREATVILLRERPKTAWIVASAGIGALCALVVTRLVSSAPDAPQPAPPVAAIAEPAPSPTAASIKFDDEDGLSIPAPIATASTTNAIRSVPAPRTFAPPRVATPSVAASAHVVALKPSATPAKLPDGSIPLGAKSAATPEPPPAVPKKPLTPEQQLAEAQLKASMR
ncbi:MAG TPA: hypothetical protein VIF62_32910 [Labilithrix sp.]